jgi:hypothetical protein
MKLSPETRIRVADDVLASAFEDEVVLLNLKDGIYYGLEGVGSRVWALVQDPAAVSEIRDALVKEFEVDAETCDRDLRALLKNLVRRGLVVITPG